MLVISRKVSQTVMLGDDVFVTVDEIHPETAILTICGPAALLVGVTRKVIQRSSNSLKIMLARKQTLRLALEIAVQVIDMRDDKVRLSIEVPPEMSVHRKEVYDALKRGRDRRQL